MPVLKIACPDCDHTYRALVVEGTRVPSVWICSQCGGRKARPVETVETSRHPWAQDGMSDCCS